MNLPLFAREYTETDWQRVMRLSGNTAAGRAFELLLRSKATAVELARPEIAGLDYRRRLTDLRVLGIPILNEPIEGKAFHRYSLPSVFVGEYWNRRRNTK